MDDILTPPDQNDGHGDYITLNAALLDEQHHANEYPEQISIRKKDKKKKKKDASDSEGEHYEYVSSSGQVFKVIPLQTKGKYDVKLHMTNERTFFKYLFSSFHLGAMGTFLLTYYSQPSIYKPALILIIWLLAFAFVGCGLHSYYQRRSFLQLGRLKNIDGLQIHGPSFVLIGFLVVFIFILLFSIATHQIPGVKTKLSEVGHDPFSASNTKNPPPPFTTVLPF